MASMPDYYSPGAKISTVPDVPANMLPSTSLPSSSSPKYSSYIGSSFSDSGFRDVMDQLTKMASQNTATSARMAQQQMDFQTREREAVQKFNASEAQKVRDWQEQLSGSAHQREVKDLIAAGLNPVLSALSGNGAQTPSGVTASSQAQAGAKGSVDTTATQGFVSLLGTMMQLLVQQENARLSAQTNLSIADKNNSVSQLIAEINNAGALARTERSGQYSLEQQARDAAAAYARALLSGEYSLRTAGVNASAAMERLLQQQSHDVFMAQNYPSNITQLVNALIGAVGSGGSSSGLGLISGLFGTGSSNPFSGLSDEIVWASLSDAQKSKIDGAYYKNGHWYRPANWRSQVEGWFR